MCVRLLAGSINTIALLGDSLSHGFERFDTCYCEAVLSMETAVQTSSKNASTAPLYTLRHFSSANKLATTFSSSITYFKSPVTAAFSASNWIPWSTTLSIRTSKWISKLFSCTQPRQHELSNHPRHFECAQRLKNKLQRSPVYPLTT